jgi:hypothetical protein
MCEKAASMGMNVNFMGDSTVSRESLVTLKAVTAAFRVAGVTA